MHCSDSVAVLSILFVQPTSVISAQHYQHLDYLFSFGYIVRLDVLGTISH